LQEYSAPEDNIFSSLIQLGRNGCMHFLVVTSKDLLKINWSNKEAIKTIKKVIKDAPSFLAVNTYNKLTNANRDEIRKLLNVGETTHSLVLAKSIEESMIEFLDELSIKYISYPNIMDDISSTK